MGVKTYFCPNCNCVLVLPSFEGESAEVNCIACRVPITLTIKNNKVVATTAPIAGRE